MRYWLICLPRPDVEHCIKIGTFGLNRKHIMGNISEGDGIVCCVSKDWMLIAIGRATSEYYMDSTKVFLKDGLFPDRFNFEAEKVSSENEIDIKQLLDRLSFIKNLAYWAVYFRNGIVEISPKDWNLISKELASSTPV